MKTPRQEIVTKCRPYRLRQYSDAIEIPEPVPIPVPAARLIVRKNQAQMTNTEKDRFKDAILALISSGFYSAHVGHHGDMTHRMHGSMSGFIGFERFLPWHRVYLDRLEEALVLLDPDLFIPYWNWTADRAIPDWLDNFTPAGITAPDGSALDITRSPGAPADLPTQQTVTDILALPDWFNFVRRLESDPHNRVHGWVGGRMNDIFFSPADLLFSLHHAEVDRIWHEWQQAHPGQGPNLSGADAVMDPWPDTIVEARHIEDLGYTYS